MPIDELLRYSPETRVFIVGDASMAPEELVDAYGSINYYREDAIPSTARLQSIRDRFPYSVWLNPISAEEWPQTHGSWTIQHIRNIFKMEDMTLRGIKSAVSYLRDQVRSTH